MGFTSTANATISVDTRGFVNLHYVACIDLRAIREPDLGFKCTRSLHRDFVTALCRSSGNGLAFITDPNPNSVH